MSSESKELADLAKEQGWELATVGGGCFWCTEAIMAQLEGVQEVRSGYMGGDVESPTYEEVCSKTTGHVEVIQIAFVKAEISFSEILDVFWQAHDPTTRDRQGADVGPQYRSVIFFHDEEQRVIAEESMRRLDESSLYSQPAVTDIVPACRFWEAEEYHQRYFERKGHENSYCQFVIAPKLKKLAPVLKSNRS